MCMIVHRLSAFTHQGLDPAGAKFVVVGNSAAPHNYKRSSTVSAASQPQVALLDLGGVTPLDLSTLDYKFIPKTTWIGSLPERFSRHLLPPFSYPPACFGCVFAGMMCVIVTRRLHQVLTPHQSSSLIQLKRKQTSHFHHPKTRLQAGLHSILFLQGGGFVALFPVCFAIIPSLAESRGGALGPGPLTLMLQSHLRLTWMQGWLLVPVAAAPLHTPEHLLCH